MAVIGKNILENLTTGMYYDSKVIYREYIQNACDQIDKAEKQKMIDGFYMLSDADKADVVANIDTYSLEDIEAKLSIICVRNKVSFNLDDDKNKGKDPTTFSLNGGLDGDETVPAWIKAIRSVASEM